MNRQPDTKRIPELDGVRALMVFIVSWFHIWQQSWLTPYVGRTSLDFLVRSGYIWVDGTILLSGFLLFMPFARAMMEGTPLPDTKDFYRRRIMRIVPSYLFDLLLVLCAVVIPFGLYTSPNYMVKDLFTHLTFTFNFWPDTYMNTPLGVVCWTLAIEMQLYLVFPLLARGAVRRPAVTIVGMTAVSWGFRLWCVLSLSDYAMVVNQMPSFLDVYALGMAGSLLYVRLCRCSAGKKTLILRQIAATLLAVFAVVLIVRVLKVQAASPSHAAIQRGQMIRRYPFALLLMLLMLSLPFSVRPLRLLMGNPVMKWLGAISMNYYILHQTLAVHLKRLHFPPSVSDLPNQAGQTLWQWQYTLLSFGLSLLLAAMVTCLVERPGARLLKKWFARIDDMPAKRIRSMTAQLTDGLAKRKTVLVQAIDADASVTAAAVDLLTQRGLQVRLAVRSIPVEQAMGGAQSASDLSGCDAVLRIGRYDAPFTPVPQSITCTAIVKDHLGRLQARRGGSTDEA